MTPPVEEARRRSASDYRFGKVLGEGSFSTVYLAKDIHTNKEYAIKVLEKAHIIREKKSEYVMREKEVLRILGSSCPYFVRLYWTFQDSEHLYFVLTYAKNGELLKQIDKCGCFTIECARYYAAEMVLALEYLHGKGIVHRDLKPENVLFDENWHILITDFGSAKILKTDNTENQKCDNDALDKGDKRRRTSFVGTAQFVSPEMLSESSSSPASDLWALGCIIYQMVSGVMPFRGRSEFLIFQKILNLEYEYPDGFDPQAKDLVQKLLVKNPIERLGATDEAPYTSIRQHELFRDLNCDDLGPPPRISDICDSIKDIVIPDDVEPGLDKEKASRLQLDLEPTPTRKKSQVVKKITDLTAAEIEQKLEAQKSNPYNSFVEGNLILKQGLIDKKKGLFARRRMFLLTFGPHLYYVDPVAMVLKGEIPWSEDLRSEAKNFKTFFIHTVSKIIFLVISFDLNSTTL
ncbi:unnamed protein product [Acanthoscelides obtectus]|uniref:3-phosphoinositide-dependent protein kinase 1 n=1 Tax=Acanthoscelides obtectus TaxID=200917 RepID=A0A9P0LS28_ACAOB|nr:unnamed protein product [Acanthoscelides obtectus]CAK1668630.1 3-phosphoinositide-dependent protein kinase 1 [Acanthoscelides obtectus]